jgi:putative spermidine/putrescine transport system ATP-binding protein
MTITTEATIVTDRALKISRGLGRKISLRRITKRYEQTDVIPALDLDIAPGELVTLLGPSGSGKTTTLMMIAGFTEPTSGEILIDGRAVTQTPPYRRGIGVVFQQYALFPHMTVAENVAFPLKMRGLSRKETKIKVQSSLDLVELGRLGHRYPAELSGGQQQRVALARAVVFDPPVLLLDEPLGALDKKLREMLQLEIKALHVNLGLTMLYVTHDQAEALAISDRVAVMNRGRVEQIGTPAELYERPASRFVADFVGEASVVSGRVERSGAGRVWLVTSDGDSLSVSAPAQPTGACVDLVIRPERVLIGADAVTTENRLMGEVIDSSYVGDAKKYRIALHSGEVITARIPNRRDAQNFLSLNSSVAVGWHPDDAMLFPSLAGKSASNPATVCLDQGADGRCALPD